MLLAGDWPRLDMTLGRIRLRRLRSLELCTRARLTSELGDSARRCSDMADDAMLPSLSAPASLSKKMDPRLLGGGMLVPACDRGVWAPLGLFEREEAAVDETLRSDLLSTDL